MQRLDERLEREAPPADIRQLWAATLLLFGLRYDATVAQQLARGVRRMRESSVYQAILEEGRESGILVGREEGREEGSAAEARRILLRLGTRKFGEPDAATAAALEHVSGRESLEELIDGILHATSWAELLAPRAGR
jgi:predicted transposase YdaD